MSETDTPIISPPMGEWLADARGIKRTRPTVDLVSVERLPDGRRILRCSQGDGAVAEFDLDAAAAAALAALLDADESEPAR